jgi:hypothetical protein
MSTATVLPVARQPSGPYGSAASLYLQQGWAGVLPLPPGEKNDPPHGFTGNYGDPSPQQISAWQVQRPGANIALRMPDVVVGLDADHYGIYRGGDTMAALEAELGPLPPTVISTSRADDPISGIKLFRIPPGLAWRDPGPGVQIIYRRWRYAVVAPSVHPEGRIYHFRYPDGSQSAIPPRPEQLPELPQPWVDYLSYEPGVSGPRVGDAQVAAFLESFVPGQPCRRVRRIVARITDAVAAGDSRHDATLKGGLALLRAGEQGHPGVAETLEWLGREFVAAVADERGGEDVAVKEWERMFDASAVSLILAKPTPADEKGCRLRTGTPADLFTDDREWCDEPAEKVATKAAQSPAGEPDTDFWAALPVLQHIHDFALSRRASPWATLGIVLARVIAATPYRVVLPPLIGDVASLNIFLALVAASGGGKGSATAAACAAVDISKGE